MSSCTNRLTFRDVVLAAHLVGQQLFDAFYFACARLALGARRLGSDARIGLACQFTLPQRLLILEQIVLHVAHDLLHALKVVPQSISLEFWACEQVRVHVHGANVVSLARDTCNQTLNAFVCLVPLVVAAQV